MKRFFVLFLHVLKLEPKLQLIMLAVALIGLIPAIRVSAIFAATRLPLIKDY
jgi:hypothetical protein